MENTISLSNDIPGGNRFSPGNIRVPLLLFLPGVLASVLLLTIFTPRTDTNPGLAAAILKDDRLGLVLDYAEFVLDSGLTAGDIYNEVWIRDLNFFVEFALRLGHAPAVRGAIVTFLQLQRDNGEIIDGFVPLELAQHAYKYSVSPLRPDLAGFKNTTETDQETSLIQVVGHYVAVTGDIDLLTQLVAGESVISRLEEAVEFLYRERYSAAHGLIWGATTADWGDVQPEDEWGVELDEYSHRALDIYDNAMLVVALGELRSLQQLTAASLSAGTVVENRLEELRKNVALHLWDSSRAKFIPHVYLEDSPFIENFDEQRVHFHGGTTVAMEANLLSESQARHLLEQAVLNKRRASAPTVGLTLFPAYPDGFFLNPQMVSRSYQNGGDWTWFGARLVRQMLRQGHYELAWRELEPMIDRVIANDGFYEWYSLDNRPQGSGAFKGSAGALGATITELQQWALAQASK